MPDPKKKTPDPLAIPKALQREVHILEALNELRGKDVSIAKIAKRKKMTSSQVRAALTLFDSWAADFNAVIAFYHPSLQRRGWKTKLKDYIRRLREDRRTKGELPDYPDVADATVADLQFRDIAITFRATQRNRWEALG